MRLAGRFKLAGMPDLREQFLAKDFGWCSIVETFPGRGIELITNLDQVGVGHR